MTQLIITQEAIASIYGGLGKGLLIQSRIQWVRCPDPLLWSKNNEINYKKDEGS